MNSETHFINPNFADLAGPYDPINKAELRMLDKAVDQLKLNPSIKYQVVDKPDGFYIQRTNMIFPRREHE